MSYRFGSREVCDVVLRAKAKMTLGNRTFFAGEPVLYFDTLKTSSMEGDSTTVYAQGGKGNPRLIAWSGDRTLTFTMEDALLSPESFAILSGAGLVDATENTPIYVHTTSTVEVKEKNKIVLDEIACWVLEGENAKATGTPVTGKTAKDFAHASADIFCMVLDNAGQVNVEPCVPAAVAYTEGKTTITCYADGKTGATDLAAGSIVLVDYYIKKTSGAKQVEIEADKFGGNFYLEGSTLFRRESDGVDMPAELIIPNGKVQSNFTFSMANSGDPSTFSFVFDAFPDYTRFDRTKKVLAIMQIMSDEEDNTVEKREACAASF